MTFLFYTFIGMFLLLSFVLCLVILVQESKSMGLGASFGGDPGTSLFGTSTAEVLKKFTATLGIIFAIMCIFLSLWTGLIGGKANSQSPPIEEVRKE